MDCEMISLGNDMDLGVTQIADEGANENIIAVDRHLGEHWSPNVRDIPDYETMSIDSIADGISLADDAIGDREALENMVHSWSNHHQDQPGVNDDEFTAFHDGAASIHSVTDDELVDDEACGDKEVEYVDVNHPHQGCRDVHVVSSFCTSTRTAPTQEPGERANPVADLRRFSHADMPLYIDTAEMGDIHTGRRDRRANQAPGNVAYRQAVNDYAGLYKSKPRNGKQKIKLVRHLLDSVIKGRFVRQEDDGRLYVLTEKEAEDKLSAALREKGKPHA